MPTGKGDPSEMRVFARRRAVMLLVCAALLLSMTDCVLAAEEPEDAAALWKAEYESLNGEKTETGESYPTVILPEGLNITLPTEEEVTGLFRNGTGVLYFGFPECPWCRTLLPVLSEVLTEHPGIGLYCYDLRADRDEYQMDEDGGLRQIREGTGFYGSLLSFLDGWIGPYRGLDDDSLKRIYMPTLVFLRDGVIQSVHISTVDGQKSGYDPLTDEQREELKSALAEGVQSISPASDEPAQPYYGFSGATGESAAE